MCSIIEVLRAINDESRRQQAEKEKPEKILNLIILNMIVLRSCYTSKSTVILLLYGALQLTFNSFHPALECILKRFEVDTIE